MAVGIAHINEQVAATIVDELIRCGLTRALISPGSRSTPLAIAFARRKEVETTVILDERSSAFFALGSAKALAAPVAIVTTSGTAVAELTPAIVEASMSNIPLIVLSSDRPFELYRSGASQTIDQSQLFAGYLASRTFIDAGAQDGHGRLRSQISRSFLEACGLWGKAAPVQINVSFREPLVSGDSSVELIAGRLGGAPWYQRVDLCQVSDREAIALELLGTRRGIIIASEHPEAEAIFALSEILGWPTFVDPRSKVARRSQYAISNFDQIVRNFDLCELEVPDVILYFGRTLTSKPLSQWLTRVGADKSRLIRHSIAGDDGEGVAQCLMAGELSHLLDCLVSIQSIATGPFDRSYTERFMAIDKKISSSIETMVEEGRLTGEALVARQLTTDLNDRDLLFGAASMAIRDIEAMMPLREDSPVVYENRGVNGIDGVIATFTGALVSHLASATNDGIGALLIGDLAFLYDLSFLREVERFSLPSLIVVNDNNGGGIFSFLSQRDQLGEVEFETLFGTPHNSDLGSLVKGFSIDVIVTKDVADLSKAISSVRSERRPLVVVFESNRDENLLAHQSFHQSITRELEAFVDELRHDS
ncbi:MAG: 2-succinyl-5-enolpyruvyl-6-hydroxy-3-cyclohexene-1-carboxylic-acid synthase [Actinomycetota bacterium]|nr:2-succinyl-5-enolpyruvyl-6-hydroxy-3-cyclohexene-1-carboxylic-acid synthase [Actinomycetota bacterium]